VQCGAAARADRAAAADGPWARAERAVDRCQ
jgi:hypothetical protein